MSPVTDGQTVQVQTAIHTLGHETKSKLCVRNTALLVVCRNSL